MNAILRFFGARVDRDGTVPALEVPATGIPLARLGAGLAGVDESAGGDRRRRALAAPDDVLRDMLAQKVLHGWLQNRHQTLLPMTVNFRGLETSKSQLLVEIMAAALLACAVADHEQRGRASNWLEGHGAGKATIAAFETALGKPKPLYLLLQKVRQTNELGPLAFILIMVVSDTRDRTDQLFAQWAAAKLDLPNTVVRSIERRYRR